MLVKEEPITKSIARESYTTQALLTVAAFAMFLLVQRTLGNAVFEKVKRYKQEYRAPRQSLDTLMASRFGLDYLLPRYMVDFMKPEMPVLLVPPAAYTRKFIKNTSCFSLTNPIYLFYMNSQVRMVSIDDAAYQKANCAMLIDKDGQCYPMKITRKDELESVVQLFRSGQPFQTEPR